MNFDLVRPDRCLKDNADINCQEQNGSLANNLKKGEKLGLGTKNYLLPGSRGGGLVGGCLSCLNKIDSIHPKAL